jgi:diguanylate cyclase (GGDEF)-like protein/PAS domain S-box-containing protein
MLGYERNEVIGMNVAKWDAQFTDLERTEALTKQFDQQVRSVFETRHRRKDGTVFDVEVSGFPLELDGQKVVFNSSRDITERKKIEKALQESESRFRTMADIVPVLIWIADLDKLCTWFNKVWLEFTGRTLEQEYGNGWAEGVHPDDFQRCLNTYVTAFDARQEFTMEYRLRRHDGEYRWLVDHGVPRFDDHGKFLGYIGSCVDITDRHAVEDMAQYRAHHDPLTDLPNRSLFGDRLRQALASAKRDQTHLAILFIDLDKFKPVNDQFGHAVGDLLLQDATKRMLNCVRESDTVARIGGDEFVVLLPSVDEEQDAVGVAEKIRHALNIPFALSGHELHISSSTGIAVYPEHGNNETQLFKHADRAMYYAKENGRNDVQLYHPAMG